MKKQAILFVEYETDEELEPLKIHPLTIACYDHLTVNNGEEVLEHVRDILNENY